MQWQGTGADMTARLRERRLSDIEKRLDGIEKKAEAIKEDWAVFKLKMDYLFYAISGVGGFAVFVTSAIATDWIRKRLKVAGNG